MPAADWKGLLATVNRLARNALIQVAGAVVVVAVVAGIILYQRWHDPKVELERGRLIGQLQRDSADYKRQLDSLRAIGARVDTVQQVVTNTITRWQTKIVHDTLVLAPTASPHDTIAAVKAQLKACRDAGDSLVASVIPLQSSCDAFKAQAQQAIAEGERRYSRLDSLYRLGPKPKRWNVSLSVGYGFMLAPSDSAVHDLRITRGLTVGVSVGRSIIQW